MIPRYPIYVPSKGRHQENRAQTVRCLMREGLPFRVVVERQETEAYVSLTGDPAKVLTLPFANLGLGSTPARNWIREHAEAEGHARHWQLDDNMPQFYRLWNGHRIPAFGGVALRVCEDLTDRFSNVGVSGLNYSTFVAAHTTQPFVANRHVYSCTLTNHAMPHRWRLRYNEDTDLCLQALTTGWATILLNAFAVRKTWTMALEGGNTDDLYRKGDDVGDDERDTVGRYEMARVLERQWPGIVTISRKFGRYQHSVNWKSFTVPLRLREDVDLAALPPVDEYGLELRAVKTARSGRVAALPDAYRNETKDHVPDPLWRGLPSFRAVPEQLRVIVRCPTEADRAALIEKLGVTISRKQKETLSAWWPPRALNDYSALRFDLSRP